VYQNYSSSLGAGNLRFNTNTQNIEVSDGQNWIAMSSQHASVGLSPIADDILDWGLAKMLEEKQLEEKAKHNKAIADLLEQKKQIEEQLKMVDILTRAG
jgi:hypothetical protein